MPHFSTPLRFLGLLVLPAILFTFGTANAAAGYYYQIKVYHFKTKAQQQVIDGYLQNAYIPLMHQWGIKSVGVFKTAEGDTTDRRIFVFTPVKNFTDLADFDVKVYKTLSTPADSSYSTAGYQSPPYTRIETIVLSAFEKMPFAAIPALTGPKSKRIYELRSYEGPTEKYYYNKVKMFNDGNEVALFKRLNFNAVFYGSVIAGATMPNLMYMTTFENMKDRDKHWDAFSNDAEWKTLSGLAEYQHNVSKNVTLFLHPAEYSDF